MFKYLQGKSRHWTEEILNSIDTAMGKCIKRMSGQLVTNLLKFVYGWQHNRQQKKLFYEECGGSECSAGCGIMESRLHFFQCKAQQQHGNQTRLQVELRRVHEKLKTAKEIY